MPHLFDKSASFYLLKAEVMMELEKAIFAHLKPMQTIYLATSQAGKPFVRPVILIYKAEKFWIATGTEDKKVGQIIANDKIEFCLPVMAEGKNGYIRAAGKAVIVKSNADREMIYNEALFIHSYWDSHLESGFTLLKLNLQEMEYMKPGENTTTTIKLYEPVYN